MTTGIDNLSLKQGAIHIPKIEEKLWNVNGLDELTSKTGQIGNIDQALKVPEVQEYTGEITEISGRVGAYQEDLDKITKSYAGQANDLPETLEEQTSRIEGIDELQKQTRVVEALNPN